MLKSLEGEYLREGEGCMVTAVRGMAVVVLMGSGAAESDCSLDEFSEVGKDSAQCPQHPDCGL